MKRTLPHKRVSKAQWLARALEVLAAEGMQGVRVDRLARDLRIARAGFYWHFKNRRNLLDSMLQYWTDEFTAVVTRNPQLLRGDPAQRLYQTALVILERNLAKYDVAIRDWSAHDKSAAKVVRQVYKMRLDFIRSLFREMGFRGGQLEMRTRLYVCYHSWERAVFQDISKTERRKLLRLQLKMLTEK